MNETLSTLFSHRSIRRFSEQAIAFSDLSLILKSGQMASSSSFLQCVSVIRVCQPEKRSALAVCAGNQPYVCTAAEFLVFCMDFQRHATLFPEAKLGMTEQTLIGAVDAGIFAQNCLIAAESLGIGGVYIGGLRNQPEQVSSLLRLPEHVFPLFGLCLGYPSDLPEQKPRLPLSILVHQDEYQALDTDEMAKYDEQMAQYYSSRTDHQKTTTWSAQMTQILEKEARPHMFTALQAKGFSLK